MNSLKEQLDQKLKELELMQQIGRLQAQMADLQNTSTATATATATPPVSKEGDETKEAREEPKWYPPNTCKDAIEHDIDQEGNNPKRWLGMTRKRGQSLLRTGSQTAVTINNKEQQPTVVHKPEQPTVQEGKGKFQKGPKEKRPITRGIGQGSSSNVLDYLSTSTPWPGPGEFQPQNPDKYPGDRYLSRRRYKLIPENCLDWIISKRSTVTDQQQEILKTVWNHVRAGTMDPKPIRAIENEFSELVRHIQTNIIRPVQAFESTEPQPARLELILDDYDEGADLKPATVENRVFPTYILQRQEWTDKFAMLQQRNKEIFEPKTEQALKSVNVISTKIGIHKLCVHGELDPILFAKLFEYGFIRYAKIILGNFVNCPEPVQQFVRDLNQRQSAEWIKIHSCPPLYQGELHLKPKEIKLSPPLIFPAVHIIKEKVISKDEWTRATTVIHENVPTNEEVRLQGIKELQRVTNTQKTRYSVFKDSGRILCLSDRVSTWQTYIREAIEKGGLAPAHLQLEDDNKEFAYSDGEEKQQIGMDNDLAQSEGSLHRRKRQRSFGGELRAGLRK